MKQKHMQYLELRENLRDFIVFSKNDILKVDSEFHNQRLSEWQKKGYIKKITKEYYIFSDLDLNESALFIIANSIYNPSYISLEMALSYHGLIPESVYSITSVTSKTTRNLRHELASFSYNKIKPALMFGYELIPHGNHNFKMAEPEKALLDYFYINPKLKTAGEFKELRINADSFAQQINIEKLRKYLEQFNNKALSKRVDNFLTFMFHA